MKIRSDFVSNSSSSSFILHRPDLQTAVKSLCQICEKYEVPWKIEDQISIRIHVKNKNWQDVTAALYDEYEGKAVNHGIYCGETNPEAVPYDSIPLRFSNLDIERLAGVVDKIEDIEFSVDDGYERLELKLLYLFFERLGCNPDALDSEQNFMSMTDNEKFMAALIAYTEENRDV